jgi:MFS family permease
VAIVLLPFIWFALGKEISQSSKVNNENQKSNYSRANLFKDKNFYLISINAIILPFLVTGLFFYQTTLASFKNWSLEWLSFSFLGFAAGRTISSLISGKLIDNYSAQKIFPLYLIPFALGLGLLLFFNHSYVAIIYLTLTGISVGLGGTIKTAVVAEIYGVHSLGGIRSVFTTIMILGTALSPILFGIIIDGGYSFSIIIYSGIGLVVFVSVLSTQIVNQKKHAM